jgi:K+-sensing histidine kinase KdpD
MEAMYYNKLNTEEVIEDSDKIMSLILADVSHEVRTQLNGILGLAQLILKSEDVDPCVQNDVRMIFESGSSLLVLFENIMEMTNC